MPGHVDPPVVFAAVHGAPCAGERAGAAGDSERRLVVALKGDLVLWETTVPVHWSRPWRALMTVQAVWLGPCRSPLAGSKTFSIRM